MSAGNGLAAQKETQLTLRSEADSEFLLFDLP